MQYLCLIYEAESLMAQRDQAQMGQIMSEYQSFTQSVKDSGEFVGGDPLMPTETATSIRVRDGKVITTDGPFAETKEQLAGYYLIEAETLDQAIKVASRIPTAKTGTIEVRPIMLMPAS